MIERSSREGPLRLVKFLAMKRPLFRLAATLSRLLPTALKQQLYRLGPISHLIRSSLNRVVPTGCAEVEIAAGALAGARMTLNLQTEKDYWLGTYETNLQTAIQALVQPGWVAYDVGANIGYISLLLARAVGEKGRVFSFEALPSNLSRLRANLALNHLGDRVVVIEGAVAATAESVRFLVGPSGAMGKVAGSAGRSYPERDALEVPGIVLDDFVYQDGHPPPQVVKMDIEGGEVLALRGMARLLAECRPLVLMELHGPQAARVSWEVLTSAGYRIHRMAPGFPPAHTLEALDWKSYLVAFPPKP